jgi:hypothetical protein
MPGSVSDSYDPEFGTSTNASLVIEAVVEVRDLVSRRIGTETLNDIVAVCEGDDGRGRDWRFDERELRIIRFCMNRALESL